jgi:hypothetical protein
VAPFPPRHWALRLETRPQLYFAIVLAIQAEVQHDCGLSSLPITVGLWEQGGSMDLPRCSIKSSLFVSSNNNNVSLTGKGKSIKHADGRQAICARSSPLVSTHSGFSASAPLRTTDTAAILRLCSLLLPTTRHWVTREKGGSMDRQPRLWFDNNPTQAPFPTQHPEDIYRRKGFIAHQAVLSYLTSGGETW